MQNKGQASISLRWAITQKDDNSVKARLVARGFEDPDIEKLVKDAPTCSKEVWLSQNRRLFV